MDKSDPSLPQSCHRKARPDSGPGGTAAPGRARPLKTGGSHSEWDAAATCALEPGPFERRPHAVGHSQTGSGRAPGQRAGRGANAARPRWSLGASPARVPNVPPNPHATPPPGSQRPHPAPARPVRPLIKRWPFQSGLPRTSARGSLSCHPAFLLRRGLRCQPCAGPREAGGKLLPGTGGPAPAGATSCARVSASSPSVGAGSQTWF